MNTQEFQEKIQKDISPDLYIEATDFEDIDRVMYKLNDKVFYVCACPKRGIREEFDKNYQSDRGDAFPSRDILEAKIRQFVEELPNNLDLYE